MRFRARALRVVLVMSLVLIMAVAGCAPQRGEKVLTIAEGALVETLDPHRSTVQSTLNVSMLICEPLAQLDYDTMEILPRLATGWTLVDDDRWRISLREGVKFTNGEDFDSESVRASILRIKEPELKSPATLYVRAIIDVEIVDKHTVDIITDGPAPVVPLYLTRIGMIPPKYLAEKGVEEFGRNPIGSGPYKLDQWTMDEQVVLVPNAGYWRGKPSLDKVVFKSIPEAATRTAALKSGEADIVSRVSIEEAESIKAASNLDVLNIPSLRMMFVQFNLVNDDTTKDKRFRKALNYAVDKDAIVDQVLDGYGVKLEGQMLSPQYFGYHPTLGEFEYNPEKARQLLKEAGIPEGFKMELLAPYGRYLKDKEVAEVIGAQLRAVGLDVTVNVLEWGIFLQKMLAKELMPMALWGAATVPDADVFFGGMAIDGAAYSTYRNPEFDRLFQEASKTMDQDQRLAIFHRMAEIAKDDPAMIYLYQQVTVWGVTDRVSGVKLTPDEGIDIWGATVK